MNNDSMMTAVYTLGDDWSYKIDSQLLQLSRSANWRDCLKSIDLVRREFVFHGSIFATTTAIAEFFAAAVQLERQFRDPAGGPADKRCQCHEESQWNPPLSQA